MPTSAFVDGDDMDTASTIPAAAETIIEITRLNACPSGIMAEFGHLYVFPFSHDMYVLFTSSRCKII